MGARKSIQALKYVASIGKLVAKQGELNTVSDILLFAKNYCNY